MAVDIKYRKSEHGLGNKAGRVLWGIVWLMFFRPSPRPMHQWRCLLLRLFGAKIGPVVRIYPSARIWAPWNLQLDANACIGDDVDCYSVDRIHLCESATVSQYSYLCSASHDYTDRSMPLVTAPITIGAGSWVCADVFVGPGVTIGEGAVVGARSSVYKDVEPWAVVAGNPARFIKRREMKPD